MKILFTNDNLIGGGAEKLINDLLPLINSEHRCDLLILTFKDEKYRSSLEKDGVRIEAVPERIKTHAGRIRYIKRYIELGEYDVVHANEFPMLYYTSIAGTMIRNRPLMVVTEHDISNRRRDHGWLRGLERFIYRGYDKIVSISPEVQQSITEWLAPMDDNKYVTICNGILLGEFREARSYDRDAVFPGIADTDILLCIVARLSYKKNHRFMLDVMEKLPNRYKLAIAGDGELYDDLYEDVNRRGLTSRVRFLGFRSDVGPIMKTADIIVIPSKWEGFGLIAVEAMACERPVVCSDIPGLSNVVGEAGIKAPLDDIDAFARAIIELEDSGIKDTVVKKGNLQCMQYDISRMKEEYVSLYANAIDSWNRKGNTSATG